MLPFDRWSVPQGPEVRVPLVDTDGVCTGGTAESVRRPAGTREFEATVHRTQLFREDCEGSREMLVLSRKAGESVVINGEIVIRVLESRGGRIRIGIDAPPSMPILRGEKIEAPHQSVGVVSAVSTNDGSAGLSETRRSASGGSGRRMALIG
jgi:carbon storage regulator